MISICNTCKWCTFACMHVCMYVYIYKLHLSLYTCMYVCIISIWYIYIYVTYRYGMATISRLLKIIDLFCKRAHQKRRYSAKETYNFKEPTTRSHPIWYMHTCTCTKIRVIYIYMHTCIHVNVYKFVCTTCPNHLTHHAVTCDVTLPLESRRGARYHTS